MKSPNYEKVDTENEDSKPKTGQGSLWINKPGYEEMFNEKKATESDEGGESKTEQEDDEHLSGDETIEMELSTFKEDPNPLDKTLNSKSELQDEEKSRTDYKVDEEPEPSDATSESFEIGEKVKDRNDLKDNEDKCRINDGDVNENPESSDPTVESFEKGMKVEETSDPENGEERFELAQDDVKEKPGHNKGEEEYFDVSEGSVGKNVPPEDDKEIPEETEESEDVNKKETDGTDKTLGE